MVAKVDEKKRYKILVGNTAHKAVAEVKGVLVKYNQLILPDGLILDVNYATPRLLWMARKTDYILGSHWFRGYPKMADDKLVGLTITSWDRNMPTNERGFESWEFIGLWTLQKTLTVQRSMAIKEIRKLAKETGFIKKYKFTFENTQDFLKSKKLWSGYVYKLLCRRNGDKIKIQKVIPYACPRNKPVKR